jgi:hypothetical protein
VHALTEKLIRSGRSEIGRSEIVLLNRKGSGES